MVCVTGGWREKAWKRKITIAQKKPQKTRRVSAVGARCVGRRGNPYEKIFDHRLCPQIITIHNDDEFAARFSSKSFSWPKLASTSRLRLAAIIGSVSLKKPSACISTLLVTLLPSGVDSKRYDPWAGIGPEVTRLQLSAQECAYKRKLGANTQRTFRGFSHF
jgi:hypothetical protein